MSKRTKAIEYKELFKFYDKDGDGFISFIEFSNLLRAYNYNPTDEQIKESVLEIKDDLNEDRISYREFLKFFKHPREFNSEDQLWDSLTYFADENGFINEKEIRPLLIKSGDLVNESEVEDFLSSFEIKDGKLDIKVLFNILTDREELKEDGEEEEGEGEENEDNEGNDEEEAKEKSKQK